MPDAASAKPEKSPVDRGGGAPTEATPSPTGVGAGVKAARSDRGWRDLWIGPALALGLVLVVGGLLTARVRAPSHDVAGALDRAAALIDREEFDPALSTLNGEVLPHMSRVAGAEDVRRFHLLRGDAIRKGAAAKGTETEATRRAVIDEYDFAEKALPAGLDAIRLAAYAECLLSLGREPDALARMRLLPPNDPARRRLLKRVINDRLRDPEIDASATLTLLNELALEEGLDDSDRVWAAARQAELRLRSGYPEEAQANLLRAMQRFGEVSGRAGGELFLLLARCYFDQGRFEEASRQLERAEPLLPETDVLRGEALALEGRISQIAGNLERARDRFAVVVAEHPGVTSAERSLLGLAEVEAALGNTPAALRAYGEAVAVASRAGSTPGEASQPAIARAEVAGSILRQHQERRERGDLDNALNFALLAENLYAENEVPRDVLLAIAEGHRALGERTLGMGGAAGERAAPPRLIDPVTRAEGRAHLAQAGAYFLRYARASILDDDAAYGRSLLSAGDCYDRAGEQDRAIEAYSEYCDGRPEDSLQPAAMLRLAQAHMARGDYGVAAQFFSELIARLPGASEGARSYVPLAQCYLLDDKEANDEEAERLLSAVVAGRTLSPDAIEYRDALVTLSRMRLRAGRFDEAIRRLTEARERWPDDPEADRLRYDLAEANRLSAGEIERSLHEAMPESQRQDLTRERRERLRAAGALYDRVRAALEAADQRSLTALDMVHLRNATFYRADCAFDLGDYDAAIAHYDAAAQRHADDPASLVAMIQIVNCYVAKGAWREAQTANERARQRLAELPEGVFDSPDLPLDRRHMERWLESSVKINARADAATQR